MANARKIAVKALLQVNKNGAYSNLTFANILSSYNDITPADKALATMLFYGVLDRKISIDYYLSQYIKTKIEKLPPITHEALNIAVYQIMFTDKIPESAAVNESVNIVKGSKERYNASFVNGVLRSLLRNRPKEPMGNDIDSLSIKYSCPLFILNELIKDYGIDKAEEFLKASLEAPPVYIRVNTVRTTESQLVDILKKEGITVNTTDTKNALEVVGGIDVKKLKAFKEGLFHIEDLACQKSLEQLALKKGERVLDMCAAPGGKSFTMAQMLENEGELLAFDLYKKRAELITDGARRLGLDIIKSACADATVFNDSLGLFDAVLCDVPCSGFGVIRRKPEIKYKEITNYSELEQIQLKILENAANYVGHGGRILYSTCTVRRAENRGVVNAFLDKHSGYELKYDYTYMPHIDKTDGFYCALLVKCR